MYLVGFEPTLVSYWSVVVRVERIILFFNTMPMWKSNRTKSYLQNLIKHVWNLIWNVAFQMLHKTKHMRVSPASCHLGSQLMYRELVQHWTTDCCEGSASPQHHPGWVWTGPSYQYEHPFLDSWRCRGSTDIDRLAAHLRILRGRRPTGCCPGRDQLTERRRLFLQYAPCVAHTDASRI